MGSQVRALTGEHGEIAAPASLLDRGPVAPAEMATL